MCTRHAVVATGSQSPVGSQETASHAQQPHAWLHEPIAPVPRTHHKPPSSAALAPPPKPSSPKPGVHTAPLQPQLTLPLSKPEELLQLFPQSHTKVTPWDSQPMNRRRCLAAAPNTTPVGGCRARLLSPPMHAQALVEQQDSCQGQAKVLHQPPPHFSLGTPWLAGSANTAGPRPKQLEWGQGLGTQQQWHCAPPAKSRAVSEIPWGQPRAWALPSQSQLLGEGESTEERWDCSAKGLGEEVKCSQPESEQRFMGRLSCYSRAGTRWPSTTANAGSKEPLCGESLIRKVDLPWAGTLWIDQDVVV